MRLNIENAAAGDPRTIRWALEALATNLKELRDRTDAGDFSSLDEFFEVFRFNDSQAAARLPQHLGWQSLDNAPEDEWIMVASASQLLEDTDLCLQVQAKWCAVEGVFKSADGWPQYDATHWRPMFCNPLQPIVPIPSERPS